MMKYKYYKRDLNVYIIEYLIIFLKTLIVVKEEDKL